MSTTTFEAIGALRQEIAGTYEVIVRRKPAVRSAGQLCDDPASAWVADAACSGRTLPINPATVAAMELAAARLREVASEA